MRKSQQNRMLTIPLENTQHEFIIRGVSEAEQTLAIHKPFWVFMGGNLGISTWLMGVIIADMGLDFVDALFVIFLGAMVGSLLPALTALIGPKSGLSQIEAGRFALGRTGKKIPALLNWVNAIGWDIVNNVISATAFITLMQEFGVGMPMWLSLLILVGIQLVIGIYGHHLIQNTAKYTGSLLVVFFVIIGLAAIEKTQLHTPVRANQDIHAIVNAFVLMVAFNLGWTTSTADYTRYLPKKTAIKTVFNLVFAALFTSLVLLCLFGYLTASVVTDNSPQGVMLALQGLSGHFAPLVMFLIWFNAIPANAMNDNSAAYTLISIGLRISRPTAAIFGAVVAYFGSLFATKAFIDFFEEFLLLFAHWITPWAAIVLVHWFIIGKKTRHTPSGITVGCWLLVLVSAGSIGFFSISPFYKGIASDYLLNFDLGPYIGFLVSGFFYYVWIRAVFYYKRNLAQRAHG